MVKPFSIQAPEQVAKEYGGNKQKIAEAAQLGLVDPTAAVLAGMFIDKMRSAQQMEAGQKPTIAQQVLGAPQPQAAPPQGMPPEMGGGLGATPQAMPPEMAMPQEMPPEMPQEMGMAEGGIVGLDLPDAMFDEPNNGGYAPGGLVAFAPGGPVAPGGWGSYFERVATEAVPGIGVNSRKRTAARNAQVGGVGDSYHLTDDARDFRPPQGVSMAQLAAQLRSKFGSGYDVIDEGDHVHVEPGPALGRMVRAGKSFDPGQVSKLRATERAPAPTAGLGATAPATGAGGDTPWGGSLSGQLEGILTNSGGLYDKLVPAPKREARDALLAYAKEQNNPEALEKQRKQDMWSTLAEIGFNMAGTNSPSFLQAVGTAAAAALPGAKADKKAREERKREMLRTYAEVEGLDNADAKERVNGMLKLAETQLGIKKEDIGRKFEQDQTMFTQGQETARAKASIASSEKIAAANNQTSKDVANISANRPTNISQAEQNATTAALAMVRDRVEKDSDYIKARLAQDAAGMAAAEQKLFERFYKMAMQNMTGAGQSAGGQFTGSGQTISLGGWED